MGLEDGLDLPNAICGDHLVVERRAQAFRFISQLTFPRAGRAGTEIPALQIDQLFAPASAILAFFQIGRGGVLECLFVGCIVFFLVKSHRLAPRSFSSKNLFKRAMSVFTSK